MLALPSFVQVPQATVGVAAFAEEQVHGRGGAVQPFALAEDLVGIAIAVDHQRVPRGQRLVIEAGAFALFACGQQAWR